MNINERFLKLSSRIPFEKDVELGQDLVVIVEGKNYIVNCVKIEYKDNQDGTQDAVYVLKYLGE